MMPSIVALIPARSGSERIPQKNMRLLGAAPLIQWTIDAARSSNVFNDILVCTDARAIVALCDELHQPVFIRPGVVSDDQPDIEWIQQVVSGMNLRRFDAFAILRPTSPFRTAETIQRAWAEFKPTYLSFDSLRAVEPVKQHPGKMWSIDKDDTLVPLLPYKHPDGTPWHSSPTQSLRPFYVQNSSLEIAWTKTVRETGTISGTKILPFFTQGDEGFSIDYPGDFEEAERRLAARVVTT